MICAESARSIPESTLLVVLRKLHRAFCFDGFDTCIIAFPRKDVIKAKTPAEALTSTGVVHWRGGRARSNAAGCHPAERASNALSVGSNPILSDRILTTAEF